MQCSPSFKENFNPLFAPRKNTQRKELFASLRLKYICPDCDSEKLETSPSTQTSGKVFSRSILISSVSSLTVKIRFSSFKPLFSTRTTSPAPAQYFWPYRWLRQYQQSPRRAGHRREPPQTSPAYR